MKQIYMKFSMLLVCLVAGLSSAWATDYVKVTTAPTDWSGEYIVVYESSETTGLVWNGLDAGQNTTSETIANGKITSSSAVTITVESLEAGGYSVKVNGGTNDGKYISSGTKAPAYSNGLKFIATATEVDFALNANGYITMSQTIGTSGTVYFVYNDNSGSSNERFRFYKDSNYKADNSGFKSPALYKKDTSAATVAVTGVTLNKSTTAINVNETTTLTATIAPTNASDARVTWSSSDTNVATVSSKGVVTGVGAGTATITATTVDGSFTATCEVTVSSVAVTGVTLDQTELSLEALTHTTLTATIAPANASNQKITWTSDNTDVATVEDGIVYALAVGTAVITATTADGNFTASCNVAVTAAVEKDEEVIVFKGSGSSIDSSVKITTDTDLKDLFAEGYGYVSSITDVYNVYAARNSIKDGEDNTVENGAKFGSSKATGSITIALKEPVYASKIIVSAAPYGDSEGQTGFILNGTTVAMTNGKNKVYADYEVSLNGAKVSEIKLELAQASSGRIYVHSITIVKGVEKELTSISVSDAGYATYYNSKSAYVMPEGMTGKTATVTNGSLTLTNVYEAGDFVPADEPLVLEANPGNYSFILGSTPNVPSTDNALEGTDEETALTTDADSYFYALSNGSNGVGFYWMVTDGAAFTNGAHKAYLKVAKTSGAGIKGFAFNGDATAINAVKTTSADDVIFDMTGRKVNAVKTGLYIVNGVKKYIK